MRISRRTSGGRGEYEVSGVFTEGIAATDLLGRRLFLDLNGLTIDTGLAARLQGGKPRLRIIAGGIQVQRQIAAVLMLPAPVRADAALGVGAPVVQTRRYAVEHVEIGSVRLVNSDAATLYARSLVLRNAISEAEEMPIAARVNHVRTIWARRNEFPSVIAGVISEHEAITTSAAPVGRSLESCVTRLQERVSESSSDLGIIYSQQVDVLPAILESLEIENQIQEPVVTVDEVDPEDVDLRRRTINEWKRWANARGPKSAVFRQMVREAYRSTCVVCGLRFSKTRITAPGVDAAHILPWSDYELDEVHNGLCLCKLHHWAFDEGLLRLSHREGEYFTEIPAGVEERILGEDPLFDMASLRMHVGRIPSSRLPPSATDRPRPQFLEMLNASEESAQEPSD